MKNLLIAGNIVMAAIIYFQACKPMKNTNSCSNVFCKTNYADRDPRGIISAVTAQRLSEAYAADTGKKWIWNVNEATTEPDALSVWYDLETLKAFIYQVEYNACRNGCGDSLGLRVYFAKYPQQLSGGLQDVNPAYANHHTLFMVPTMWDHINRRNIDFNPLRGCRPITDTAFVFFGMGTGSLDGDEQNHGGLMPPPAGTGTFPSN